MTAAEAAAEPIEEPPVKPPSGRRRLLLLAAGPAALLALGGGAWFSGVLPRFIGMEQGGTDDARQQARIFIELPELVANLNSDPRRPRYVKLKVQVVVSGKTDAATVNASIARLQDLLQTYLREMRPEDLLGAAGTYRLRQELIARADIALAPARLRDLLFTEMLVQ